MASLDCFQVDLFKGGIKGDRIRSHWGEGICGDKFEGERYLFKIRIGHYRDRPKGLYSRMNNLLLKQNNLIMGFLHLAFRIVEKDRPGTLLVDKLQSMGVKPGPLYKKVKAGESIALEDGTVLDACEFVGPHQKGRIITILGDTRMCESAQTLASDADLLIHEATFANGEEALAHNYYHSTTSQAAEIARRANVKKLCLTHISARYDRNTACELLKEARTIFPQTEIAEDFKSILIPR